MLAGCREPVVLVVSIYTSLAFAVIYGFFASIPYIFIAVYAFDQHQVGLVFVAAIVGYLCSLPTMLAVDKLSLRWFARKKKDGQTPSPNELALLQSMLGAPFFPISLFWLGWSARTDIHFMVPTVAVALYSWSSVQIYLGTISYLARIYGPKFGASAAAADRVLSFLFGVAFPLFTTQSKFWR